MYGTLCMSENIRHVTIVYTFVGASSVNIFVLPTAFNCEL